MADTADAMALNAQGMQALGRSDFAAAQEFFARAAAADPDAPALWINLATAQRRAGDVEGERASLTRVLAIDQRHLMANIRLAELHERLNETAAATQRWSAVAAIGQMIQEVPANLVSVFAHANAFVAEQGARFGAIVDRGLAEARGAVDAQARRRVDAAVDAVLGRRRIFNNECHGLHFPFLPADEFFQRRHFPWMAEIEARTDAIRAEFEALVSESLEGFVPYVAMDAGTPQNKWSALDHSLDWASFFLWRFGERIDEACARCPETAAALEALPLADMPRRAPTAFFSVLKPGVRLPAHTGVSNARAIVHLPLIIPPGCALRVGGETREWRLGEAFAFDDTIDHEAWNESDRLRAVLIFDVWNPHIREEERALLRTFFSVADESGLAVAASD